MFEIINVVERVTPRTLPGFPATISMIKRMMNNETIRCFFMMIMFRENNGIFKDYFTAGYLRPYKMMISPSSGTYTFP